MKSFSKKRIKLSMFVLSMAGLSACLSGCMVAIPILIIAIANADNYTAVATFPKPAEEVYGAAKKAIQGEPHVKIVKENAKKFHIEARNRANDVSIKMDIKVIDTKSCEVTVAAYGDQKDYEARDLTNRVFEKLCDRLGVKHELIITDKQKEKEEKEDREREEKEKKDKEAIRVSLLNSVRLGR
jgi:hypothetical protein